ncbi:MAG TPA: hypothetical protein VHL32_01590 [Gemmatimonadaceae bacterium]|jgi:hypothetical protein|nr:hypothetical protein [Gemmatimonadaceae bacterium]
MIRQLALTALLATVVTSCNSKPKPFELRLWSDNYAFRVTSDPLPPVALEQITYRIVVQDKKTGQPIEGGEGRIFATSADRANTDDGLKKEKELGTYSGKIFFATSGDWAAAIQFRREKDPRMPLERVDWIQAVRPSAEPGT